MITVAFFISVAVNYRSSPQKRSMQPTEIRDVYLGDAAL